jgi:hypothetical protein
MIMFKVNVEFHPGNAGLVAAVPMQVIALQMQLSELGFQLAGVHS